MAVLDIHCYTWAFSSCVKRGLRTSWAHWLSTCVVQAQLLCGMRDLSSLTRDQTCVPCIARQILNHWTTREVPNLVTLIAFMFGFP